MDPITLIIHGQPKAQKRHRTYTKGRDGKPLKFPRQVDPNKQTKANLVASVQSRRPYQPFEGPLGVNIVAFFRRPKSHYRTGRYARLLKPTAPVWHTSRPDRDNIDKLVLDALTGVFWRDDSQVCAGYVKKAYSETPSMEITIWRLNPYG